MKPLKQPLKNDGKSQTNHHHVTPGDVLYYTHEKDGPTTGEVLAHGQHGCTLKHTKGHVQVPWDRIHGHKSRVPLEMRVEDQGEDGAIVKAKDGKRHFVHGFGEEESQPHEKRALLFKADSASRDVVEGEEMNKDTTFDSSWDYYDCPQEREGSSLTAEQKQYIEARKQRMLKMSGINQAANKAQSQSKDTQGPSV